jgi:hypothetical protein
MTTEFVRMVLRLVPIRRLMISSPWISLDRDRHRQLVHGIESSRRDRGYYPEITVVTRPPSEQPGRAETETLAYLRRANAVIRFHGALHSKLYIIESSAAQPQRVAFVGSENFTKVRYQEVGVRISNDNQLIEELVRYFVDLATL